MSTPNLIIYSAAYGRADVTGKVREQRKDQKLSVQASNAVFGDSWPGVPKSLVVVYKYETENAQVKVGIVREGETLNLTPPKDGKKVVKDYRRLAALADVKCQPKLEILGAAYGLGDVTAKASSLVTVNGEFNQVASNSVWGDTWPGTKKSLVVVYTCSGVVMQDIVTEGQTMHFIASPPLTILEAAYGLSNVTNKVGSLVRNASLCVTANNETFGDGWPNARKSLVVIYQYGEETPKVAIAKENDVLQFLYSHGTKYLGPTDPNALTILGAAYGLADVTAKTQSLVKDRKLHVTAENSVFGDSWPGVQKSLVVAYRYGRNAPQLKIEPEGKVMSISSYVPPSNADLIDINDLFHDGDRFALTAINNKYVTCDKNSKLVATQDLSNTGCTLIVKKPARGSPFKIQSDNGKYVAVGDDNALYATATAEGATEFHLSISRKGGLRFATAAGLYIYLGPNDELIADAVDYFGATAIFGIALHQDEGRYGHLDLVESVSECELAWISFAWSLTAGFFLAIGLGPYIARGEARPGALNLIRSNPRAWAAVQQLAQTIIRAGSNNIKKVITAALGVISVLYHEGVLWSIFKFMLKSSIWFGITWALAKIIEIVFLPEVEAAELLASFTVWAVQTVQAGLQVGQACN